MTYEERVCGRCNKAKHVGDFATYNRGGKKLPLRTCKGCHREQERQRQRRYVEANREAHNRRSRENKKARYQKDPEFRAKMILRSKQHYEASKSVFRPKFVRSPRPWEEIDEA